MPNFLGYPNHDGDWMRLDGMGQWLGDERRVGGWLGVLHAAWLRCTRGVPGRAELGPAITWPVWFPLTRAHLHICVSTQDAGQSSVILGQAYPKT